jgi:hypothetical protein
MTANKDRLHVQVENLCLTAEGENKSGARVDPVAQFIEWKSPGTAKTKEKLGLNT